MRFTFNINKKHAIVILLLLVISGFGIAQVTPNPGHSLSEVPGAAANCLASPTNPACTGPAIGFVNTWGAGNTAIAAGKAYSSVISQNSQQLGAKPADRYITSGCIIRDSLGGTSDEHVSCNLNLDEVLVSGGCTPSTTTGIRISRPEVDNYGVVSWYCLFTGTGTATALCCENGDG